MGRAMKHGDARKEEEHGIAWALYGRVERMLGIGAKTEPRTRVPRPGNICWVTTAAPCQCTHAATMHSAWHASPLSFRHPPFCIAAAAAVPCVMCGDAGRRSYEND
eukprot:258763-Chlamydomonas_euryale.AAC.2